MHCHLAAIHIIIFQGAARSLNVSLDTMVDCILCVLGESHNVLNSPVWSPRPFKCP